MTFTVGGRCLSQVMVKHISFRVSCPTHMLLVQELADERDYAGIVFVSSASGVNVSVFFTCFEAMATGCVIGAA